MAFQPSAQGFPLSIGARQSQESPKSQPDRKFRIVWSAAQPVRLWSAQTEDRGAHSNGGGIDIGEDAQVRCGRHVVDHPKCRLHPYPAEGLVPRRLHLAQQVHPLGDVFVLCGAGPVLFVRRKFTYLRNQQRDGVRGFEDILGVAGQ